MKPLLILLPLIFSSCITTFHDTSRGIHSTAIGPGARVEVRNSPASLTAISSTEKTSASTLGAIATLASKIFF